MFHLWTHPFNLAGDPEFMAATLESIVRAAAEARDRGEIRIETMGGIAGRLATAPAGA